MDNYCILHLHSMDSNPYSGLEVDSITPYQSYIDKAQENSMKAIAFTEHGAVLHNIAKKQACEKAGIKYIHAAEFYVTEKMDKENMVRDNYHCCLYARNHDGVLELNKLSSNSFDRNDGHFYYNPRISMAELESTSDNILVLTACVGGILCKGSKSAQERFLNFIIKNKHRCWLEIQPHNFDLQIRYNQYLYGLSLKYGIRLIATNDIHEIDHEHAEGRKKMQISKKVNFHDEDECDLTFKTYEGLVAAFKKQGAIPESVFTQAINETNNFAEEIKDYALDYTNKYPRLYKNAEEEFVKRIKQGIVERGIDKLPDYQSKYIPRIKEELETYKHNDAIDFMLLDSDYKEWLLSKNMHYGPSRGSVSGSLIAYLLHNTDVDSVKYDLNFSRFMNTERMSLADVDTDIYADDRYKVREYLFEKEGLYCCNIITFNTIQLKGAIKDIGRAYGMTPSETQELSDLTQVDEKGHDFMPEEIRNKYPEMFKYIDMVIGTITSLGRHAAGIVCSPTDVGSDFATLSISSDPRPVSQIDMHEIDSLNYVKLDLLGLNAIGLIDGACKLANIDFLTPDMIDFSDQNVIDSISEDTTLIFQFESGFASDALKQTLSKDTIKNMKINNENISYLDIMAMVNGAIRPSGESYRDALFKGIYKDNGNDVLNKFLSPTLGYLVYQEQIIDFLHYFCDFTMGQADIVRRHFAKKQKNKDGIPMTEIDAPIIENGGYMEDIKGNKDTRYIKGFVSVAQEKYGMTETEAKAAISYFVEVIKDASFYIFSKNHAVPYSMLGFFIGWLRCYHKIELLTSALNVYSANAAKVTNIKAYIDSQGISIKGAKFRKSKALYFMDRDENSIYQGIESISFCNQIIADELFELGKRQYDSFIDLLVTIKEESSVDSKQLEILMRVDYFSDFGSIGKLLMLAKIFNDIYDKTKKCFKKQMAKEKIAQTSLTHEAISAYCHKETEKTYMQVDFYGMIKDIEKNVEFLDISDYEKASYQQTIMKRVDIKSKKHKGIAVVVSVDTKYSPKLKCYAMANGNTIECKINKKLFWQFPLEEGDVIEINETMTKPRQTKTEEGKWVDVQGTKVLWITGYRRIFHQEKKEKTGGKKVG